MNKESSRRRARSKPRDLKPRTDRAGTVRGGIIINWAPAAGSNKPGEERGVIAIIRPEGSTR